MVWKTGLAEGGRAGRRDSEKPLPVFVLIVLLD